MRKKRNNGTTLADKFVWARLEMLWVAVRDSLWFIPATLTVTGGVLAVLLVQAERLELLPWKGEEELWLFSGDANSAIQLLSAIVGGLMTVTGVAFSVTIVAIQLASSQFTPRVLRNFTADRPNQIVLGVLIGTFTYGVLVLRAIRSADSGVGEFVPRVAVTSGVALTLLSIACLIFFINHVAASMRITVILERVSRETLNHVRRYYPEAFDPARDRSTADGSAPEPIACVVEAEKAGYIQAVDSAALTDLARRNKIQIRMARKAGQFVLKGQSLAYAYPAYAADESIRHAICEAVVIGRERTPEQDVEFGIIEITDIAVKALSSSFNDPTTAMRCIDRLNEILCEFGARSPPVEEMNEHGETFFRARHLRFERAVGLAFGQIRHFGISNPFIVRKLAHALTVLASLLPPERQEVLAAQMEAVLAGAKATAGAEISADEIDALRQEFQRTCRRRIEHR